MKKKIAQRAMLIAQAEVRETRTRRKANRPDYAYLNDPTEEVRVCIINSILTAEILKTLLRTIKMSINSKMKKRNTIDSTMTSLLTRTVLQLAVGLPRTGQQEGQHGPLR